MRCPLKVVCPRVMAPGTPAACSMPVQVAGFAAQSVHGAAHCSVKQGNGGHRPQALTSPSSMRPSQLSSMPVADLDRLEAATAATVRDPFVDAAVAVVVQPVADLGGHAEAAGVAADGPALVDRAVAVVVDAVADFRAGHHLADARAPPGHLAALAGLGAGEAGPDPTGARRAAVAGQRGACAQTVLVDEAVAVVVEAIAADLGRVGEPAVAAGAGDALVDGAVAVVVDAVASLRERPDGWRPSGRRSLPGPGTRRRRRRRSHRPPCRCSRRRGRWSGRPRTPRPGSPARRRRPSGTRPRRCRRSRGGRRGRCPSRPSRTGRRSRAGSPARCRCRRSPQRTGTGSRSCSLRRRPRRSCCRCRRRRSPSASSASSPHALRSLSSTLPSQLSSMPLQVSGAWNHLALAGAQTAVQAAGLASAAARADPLRRRGPGVAGHHLAVAALTANLVRLAVAVVVLAVPAQLDRTRVNRRVAVVAVVRAGAGRRIARRPSLSASTQTGGVPLSPGSWPESPAEAVGRHAESTQTLPAGQSSSARQEVTIRLWPQLQPVANTAAARTANATESGLRSMGPSRCGKQRAHRTRTRLRKPRCA